VRATSAATSPRRPRLDQRATAGEDQDRDRAVRQAVADGVEEQREVDRADGAGGQRPLRLASANVGSVSDPRVPVGLRTIIATATRSAATTHAVAMIGWSATIQPATPAPA
jgi:hypothetical protein